MSALKWFKKLKFGEATAIVITVFTHWVIFYFILINSFKTKAEAAKLTLNWPSEWSILDNYKYVLTYQNNIFLRALGNSIWVTVCTMAVLVLVSATTAFIVQRRGGAITKISDKLILAGLIAPLAIVPTYWVLARLQLANTITGLILVEIALLFPYSTMLYKGYIAAIPREIDEAAIVDGCGPWQLFFKIMVPLIKPITATVIILRTFVVYNDFTNPLYFLSGTKSATVQLCIYTFKSTYSTDWGRMFAAVVLVSIPPLLVFVALHKRIMEGMTMGAVKG